MPVEKGNAVKFNYTGKLQNGTVFTKNKENELVECTVGEGKIIKGVEEGLLGMEVSEKREVLVPPEKGYGIRDEKLVKQYPRKIFSDSIKNIEGKVGEVVHLQHKDNTPFSARVVDVNNENVTLDLNHPLASTTITFELEVVEIK